MGDNIRTPRISMAASAVSAIPQVRAFLLDLQRNVALNNNVVMDGRDIATVVLPDAQVKIFLTARPEVRAARRYEELRAKGSQVTYEQVLEDMKKRDEDDSNREVAPLKPSADSVIADTSDLDLEQSFELLMNIVRQKTETPDGGAQLISAEPAVSAQSADSAQPEKKKKRRARRQHAVPPIKAFAFWSKFLRPFAKLFFGIKVKGAENLPQSGRLVICCNHLKYKDPVMVGFSFNRPINYIAKKTLFDKPLLRGLIRSLGAIPVDRDKADLDMFRTVESILKMERVVGIFPEGHRSADSTLNEGKAGVGMIVLRNWAPVLPVALKYVRHGPFCSTRINFGKVITPDELDSEGKQRYQHCADLIMRRIAQLADEI